jgi:hypothetical protein
MLLAGARPSEPLTPIPAVTTGPLPLSNQSACAPTGWPSVKPLSKSSANAPGPGLGVAVGVAVGVGVGVGGPATVSPRHTSSMKVSWITRSV